MAKHSYKQEAVTKTSKKINISIFFIIFLAVCIILKIDPFPESGVSDVSGEVQVHFIDVGQGDCVFVQTNSSNILIDCGERSEIDTVEGYLKNKGVSEINLLVATHPHSDHMGGMATIVQDFDVNQILMPEVFEKLQPTTVFYEKFLEAVENKGLGITKAEPGDTYTFGDAVFEVLAPIGQDYSDLNNFSVVMELTFGDTSFLFTGDAEKESEEVMIENGVLEDIDVLKVGHHGSAYSTTDEFLDIIRPEIAVISCGAGNSYGHPTDDCIERLGNHNSDIYRTDLSGTIVLTTDGTDITIN